MKVRSGHEVLVFVAHIQDSLVCRKHVFSCKDRVCLILHLRLTRQSLCVLLCELVRILLIIQCTCIVSWLRAHKAVSTICSSMHFIGCALKTVPVLNRPLSLGCCGSKCIRQIRCILLKLPSILYLTKFGLKLLFKIRWSLLCLCSPCDVLFMQGKAICNRSADLVVHIKRIMHKRVCSEPLCECLFHPVHLLLCLLLFGSL